jgi:hypothetical protein
VRATTAVTPATTILTALVMASSATVAFNPGSGMAANAEHAAG